MDLSKLPRLSETPPPPPPPPDDSLPRQGAAPYGTPKDYGRDVGTPLGAEVWISLILAFIFLMLGWNFARYAACLLTGRTYHTQIEWSAGTEKAGAEVSYPELQGYVIWNDSAMFSFGLTLLLEAVVLLAVGLKWRLQKPLIVLGFATAFLATLYNLIVAGIFFSSGVLPILSLLAVAFGGYIAIHLWRLLQSLRAIRPT